MKRAKPGTYKSYEQASKRIAKKAAAGKTRAGYTSVARTRGAAVTGEMKYFDCDRTPSNIVATTTTWPAGTMQDPGTTINLGAAAVGTPQCLFAPTVGSALNQRIGRSVLVRKIKVTGTIAIPSQVAQNALDEAMKIRLLLVQDMQTNAAQMTAAALLNDASAATTTICSYQNPNNFGRFRVLKDKIYSLQDPNLVGSAGAAPTDIGSNGKIINFKMAVNFKIPVKVQFNATNGGTVADIVDNSFHIICGASNISFTPTISYYSRVAYKE